MKFKNGIWKGWAIVSRKGDFDGSTIYTSKRQAKTYAFVKGDNIVRIKVVFVRREKEKEAKR